MTKKRKSVLKMDDKSPSENAFGEAAFYRVRKDEDAAADETSVDKEEEQEASTVEESTPEIGESADQPEPAPEAKKKKKTAKPKPTTADPEADTWPQLPKNKTNIYITVEAEDLLARLKRHFKRRDENFYAAGRVIEIALKTLAEKEKIQT